jgi:hypothetical protein
MRNWELNPLKLHRYILLLLLLVFVVRGKESDCVLVSNVMFCSH